MIAIPRTIGVGRFIPSALMVSAFSPLLFPSIGISIGQIFIYLLLPIALGLLCVSGKTLFSYTPVLFLLSIFCFITVWTLVVTFGGLQSHVTPTNRTLLDEIGSLESYLQTIVVIIIMGAFIKIHDIQTTLLLLEKVAKILIILMSINAVIALAAINFDTSSFTGYFGREEEGAGGAPLKIDSGTGRFIGIFDFPSSAGHAYSLALIMWTYLVRKVTRISLVMYMMAALIIVGGAVSVSKVFLFGGLPIFFVYWMIPGRLSPRMSLKMLVVLAVIIALIAMFVESWIGTRLIIDLFTSDEKYTPFNLFLHFIYIRYGIRDDLSVGGIFAYIWQVAPVQGLGFSYLGVADSAYLQYFMQGGLISLLLYFGFIFSVIFMGANDWYRGVEMGKLLMILGIFVLLAGVGSPVITTSRISVIFWVVLMSVFAVGAAQRTERSRHDKVVPDVKHRTNIIVQSG